MEATKTPELKELSKDLVNAISGSFNEPEWLQQWRSEAWSAYEALPLPGTRYTFVRGLDLNSIQPVVERREGVSVPAEFEALASEKSGNGGTLIHVDGQVIRSELSESLKSKGVLFMDISQAISEYPDIVQQHFESLETAEDRITALQRALFNCGPFLYVPKGVIVDEPLEAIQILTQPGLGLFSQGLIIAEAESSVTYIEELYSPKEKFENYATQANGTRVYVGQNAQVNFAAVQNWNSNVFNFTRRSGQVERDAKLRWTKGWLGGRLTMSHVENILNGPGAEVEDVQVYFTTGRQQFDLTSNLGHNAPDTRGEVTVKGVLKNTSQASFWGRIRIEPGAQRSNAYLSARSLLVENGPRSNAIPSLEIEANDVRCTHAASASQIDEDSLFYLRSRGFDADQARKTIVDGFFEPTVAGIPLESVQERLRDLIDQKWAGEA
jgi:FeS assembly protein SufD